MSAENIWLKLAKPIKILAPMEDVTDSAFRRIFLDCGRPDLFFSEFTSAEGLISPGRLAVGHRLEFTPEEKPIIAQIWGLSPDKHFRAARLIAEMGFDGVDINMGCPVAKIVKNGACSALIDNPILAAEIIKATQEGAGNLPVSVKTRLGVRTIQTESWYEHLLKLDLAAITVHGRLAKDISDKPAQWAEIKKVVELRNSLRKQTIIIGNGDVQNLIDLDNKVQETGVDGVMVGRAALFNPLFFHPAGRDIKELPRYEKIQLLLKHLEMYAERWGEDASLGVMKKFSGVYLNNFSGASALRQRLVELRTNGQAILMLNEALHCNSNCNSNTIVIID